MRAVAATNVPQRSSVHFLVCALMYSWAMVTVLPTVDSSQDVGSRSIVRIISVGYEVHQFVCRMGPPLEYASRCWRSHSAILRWYIYACNIVKHLKAFEARRCCYSDRRGGRQIHARGEGRRGGRGKPHASRRVWLTRSVFPIITAVDIRIFLDACTKYYVLRSKSCPARGICCRVSREV